MYDFAIVGAGMAGASLAAALARHGRVLLLEAEDHPGYHATGRSAAFWEECYGGAEIVPLTLASGPLLRAGGFLRQRGALYIGRARDAALFEAFEAEFGGSGAEFERLGRARLAEIVPGILPPWTEAIWEPGCADIDVAGLHGAYLKQARSGGATLVTRARLATAEHGSTGWALTSEDGRAFAAGKLINAAGAWADEVAQIAGVRPIGIQPLRRTVAQLRVAPQPPEDLPLVLDIAGTFYFKPDSGRLWLSPHDEEPSAACDAAPEELAVAEAIDRFEAVVGWRIEAVERKWAGLRSFAPDRRPVYGPDPSNAAFFWFAGQGGYGIQTAPAAAALAAQLITGKSAGPVTEALDPALYSPGRFA